MPLTTEKTTFTRDVQGRYLCNDLTEVNAWKNSGGRPFDVIVIGGGTWRRHRRAYLVSSEANWRWAANACHRGGIIHDPGTCAEHRIQGLTDPLTPFSLNENAPQPEPPRNEVWGIPWKSSIPFKGLAYTVGGRSVYWGGWSPRLLDAEVTTWPAQTVAGSQDGVLRRKHASDWCR